jgi:hypothetical protein
MDNVVWSLLHFHICRLNEIRVLKVRLADMRRELHVLRTGVANVDVLKREVRPPSSHQQTPGRAHNLLSKHIMHMCMLVMPACIEACVGCAQQHADDVP